MLHAFNLAGTIELQTGKNMVFLIQGIIITSRVIVIILSVAALGMAILTFFYIKPLLKRLRHPKS